MRRSTGIVLSILALAIVAVAIVVIHPFRDGSKIETATVTRGSLDSTVELAGSVIPVAARSLSFATTGLVTSVTVRVGDVVIAGQVLATLDDTLARAQVRAGETALASAQARLAADTGGLTPAQLAQAQDGVTQAQQALNAANAGATAARTQRDSAVAAATTVLDDAKARLGSDTASGAADPVLSIDRLAVQAAQANLTNVTNQGDAAVAQASAAVTSARSALTSAQHAFAVRTASAPDALIAADQAAVASADASLAAARQTLAAATITSPIQGTVTDVGLAVGDRAGAIGASVTGGLGSSGLGAGLVGGTGSGTGGSTGGSATGATAGSSGGSSSGSGRIVVSDLSSLQVSASASEIDVVSLALDQRATITLDALPDLSTGATICALGSTGSSASGVVEYPVTLCLDQRDRRLRVGMSANISIVLAHRDSVLIVPTPAVTTSGGTSTVRILHDDGSIEHVDVGVGISSGTRLEITSGLHEGDRVVIGGSSSGG